DNAVSMLMRLSISPQSEADELRLLQRRTNVIPEPTYGGQLQDLATPGQPIEGRIHVTYTERMVTLGDGTLVSLRQPTYRVTDLGFGPLHPDTMLSARVAPQMIGLGLLEAIREADIRANADPDDADGDGISGRTSEVWSREADGIALGRFGWKAGNPTVRQQTADAFSGDMGLSTSLFPKNAGDCTDAQTNCLKAPHGNDTVEGTPEVTDDMLKLVTFYAQNLAVPARRNLGSPEVSRGKSLFAEAGCASCHTPSFVTGQVDGQRHLSHQRIWPYTDLLLHDMGEGLADNRPDGVASGREWRTPPLWGIGLTQVVNGHTNFLHDGRARSIEEAILWHGGEAEKARDAYATMSKTERDALIAFVNSL
ncbi:MAG: di-heme oxidoredictase family protein, partial [Pseudomonadota bacterium]